MAFFEPRYVIVKDTETKICEMHKKAHRSNARTLYHMEMKFNYMTTFKENLCHHRRRYAAMRSKKSRTAFLDQLTALLGIERKYLNKLLRGKRKYKSHVGRSPTYTPGARALLAALWRVAGMPCAEYLKPMLAKLAADYAALGNPVEPNEIAQVLCMSASTIGRSIRALHPSRPLRRNRCSGAHALKKSIPEIPGTLLPEDKPGVCQVDTVALCGGDMSESFFYIATLTDAVTQWFECAPSWNRSAVSTSRAMTGIRERLPFEISHLHPDNGSEFINTLFINELKKAVPGIELSRSRPYRKNDNCRIEQKNGSVIREYFSDIRFDLHSQYAALEAVCRDIALFTNLFRPCKKLVCKERKEGKGVKYTKRYDAPRTPLKRLCEFLPDDNPERIALTKLCDSINSITLLKSIHHQLRCLVRELAPPPPSGRHTVPKEGRITK